MESDVFIQNEIDVVRDVKMQISEKQHCIWSLSIHHATFIRATFI